MGMQGNNDYEINKFYGRQGFVAERVEQVRNLYHGGDMRILSDNNAKKMQYLEGK